MIQRRLNKKPRKQKKPYRDGKTTRRLNLHQAMQITTRYVSSHIKKCFLYIWSYSLNVSWKSSILGFRFQWHFEVYFLMSCSVLTNHFSIFVVTTQGLWLQGVFWEMSDHLACWNPIILATSREETLLLCRHCRFLNRLLFVKHNYTQSVNQELVLTLVYYNLGQRYCNSNASLWCL